MYSSQALPNTLNHSFPTAYKPAKEDLQESREAATSGFQHQQQQMNAGLMRFSSAPGSLLTNFVDGGEGGDDFLPRSSSIEAETMLARLNFPHHSASPDIRKIEEKGMGNQRSPRFTAANESELKIDVPQQNRSSSAWPMHIQMQQHQNHSSQNGAAIGSSFGVLNSIPMNSQQVKGGSNCANLTRHSSSPAGLFSNLTVENGYVAMRGMGNVRAGTDGEAASTSSLSNHTSFLSRQSSSPGLLSKISEMGAENIASRVAEDGSLENPNGGSTCSVPGYRISSWDDLPLGENLTGSKRPRDINGKMTTGLNRADTLNGEPGTALLHQLSFPKTALEMDALEKILQFQDSVPCKIRAKRGFATHPRSIAERVRRTRISERMRKLQELVPNMDKQTNTADMLDLAVEYIKELQKQVKTLKDNQGSCTCSSKQKPNPSSAA